MLNSKQDRMTMIRTIPAMLMLGMVVGMAPCGAQSVEILENEFIYEESTFPSCHASTIEKIPGGVIAAWFGGTAEKDPDVEIYMSRKLNGEEWSTPVSVANGIQHDDKRYPCWNPVLFRYPDGPLLLFYKVGPNPDEWWGELICSYDDGLTWSESRRLPEDILGPIKNKPILLENGDLICPSSAEQDGWRVHFEISSDTGKTWKLIGPINDAKKYDVIQPSILQYGDGKLQILCRSRQSAIITSWSDDNGLTWSPLEMTGLPNPNSGTDAVTLSNGIQLLVYNPTEIRPGQWGGPRTPLSVAVSKNGMEWKEVCVLEDARGEYSYPAVIQDSEGFIHITYTWKRQKIKYVKLSIEE